MKKRIPVEVYEHLSNKVSYDPISGDIRWVKAPKKYMKDNQIAGTIQGWGYRNIGTTFGDRQYLIRAHILAWYMYYGCLPKGVIDHLDGVKDNNAITNLRDTDRSGNNYNKREFKNKKNKTGYTGVYLINGKYRAAIGMNGTTKCLGTFIDIKDAINARLEAEEKLGVINFNKSVGNRGFENAR